ncbi:MAG: ribosome maturation factor RimM [Streptococcaceae bacterium]|jgi:16S rRNA processing protein RimM|nr:ribosome maturation factor RimM [Streptococcaceae bacterium]
MSEYYRVAVIVNTQGLQGEVRVKSFSDFPEARFKKGVALALFDKSGTFVENLTVTRARAAKNLWIVKFSGIDNINSAEKLRDFTLKIAAENLSDLDEGEFYYHEIIGLDVYENDKRIGQISEILQPGANDVWVIKRQGKADLLLPYIPSVVLSVDLSGKRVNVEVPEGLDD